MKNQTTSTFIFDIKFQQLFSKIMISRFLFYFVLSFLIYGCSKNNSDILIEKLRVEYKENPEGIDDLNPRFFWQLISERMNKSQTAYQIIVASSQKLIDNDSGDIWDSQKVLSSSNKQIDYQGESLKSKQKYYWKVRIWDEKNLEAKWSEVNHWSMGLLNNEDWKAKWISYKTEDFNLKDTLHLPPSPYFRKVFNVKNDVKRASLYVSSLGIFEASINGEKIGNDLFAPGWTDYNKRIYYKTYDITNQIEKGDNALGSIVADGWYAGYVGPYSLSRPRNRELYGVTPALICQLEIEYINGEKETIISDETWKANEGPIVYADLLMGESYNANFELDNWNTVSYNDSEWNKVQISEDAKGILQAYPGQTIRKYAELNCKNITEPDKGVYIFDLGQNFAGHARLKVSSTKNDTIVMRFGEMLHPDGRLMTENLRFAKATDTYIVKGDDIEEWEPKFTYHGFRYVEVTGLKNAPSNETITGIGVSSVSSITSSLKTSDSLVNQLYSNIVWTQKSNFMDVPTDCPQRDERLGWLGDAQIFSKSSLYNSNLAAFYKKWITDVEDAQYDFGAYANFAPKPYPKLVWYSPGWMEAGVMIPYNIYKFYGDTKLIETHYESMTKFMDFHIKKTGEDYFYPENSWTEIGPKGGFGDWLSLTDKNLAHDMMASMYFLNSVNLMKEMSKAIGNSEKSKYYETIFRKGQANFINHYMNEDGKFKIDESEYGDGKGYYEGRKGFTGHTQSAYASAIYFNLLPKPLEEKAAIHLKNLIDEAEGKPTSGILGIRQLLPSLSKVDMSDLAYTILLNKEYPGWGFEIENGATTIWERWNSYTHEKGFGGAMNAKMNSFNHYAFGAVSEYLFSNLGGIETEDAGYNNIIIKPDIGDKSIDWVTASYNSINGEVKSSWKIEDSKFSLDVQIPVSTKAKVYIPKNLNGITEELTLSNEIKKVKLIDERINYNVYEIGSGNYRFRSDI